MVETSVEERMLYCDEEFLQLALVIMSNDSASYTFILNYEAMRRYDQEFKQSHNKMMAEIKEAQQV